MSKILRRPMFRGGGKVSSYGNGIATGLADGGIPEKRGLVDGPGGYAGEFKTGSQVVKEAPGIFNNFKFNKPFFSIPTPEKRMGETKFNLGNFGMSPSDLSEALSEDSSYREYLTPEIEEFETETTDTGDTKFKLDDKGNRIPILKEGKDLSLAETIAISRDAERDTQGMDLVDLGLATQGQSSSGLPGTNILDERNKKIDDLSKLDTSLANGVLENQNKVSDDSELTLEEIKESLGSKKAFGRDLSDTLLTFAGAEGDTVMEKFKNTAALEAKKGPSRTETIDQAAATFMLKDKLQTKRDKAKVEMMRADVDYKIAAGKKIDIAEGILASTKGGQTTDKKLAIGIQSSTSPTTGSRYVFRGVVKAENLTSVLNSGQLKTGDTLIVKQTIKDEDSGADKTLKKIIEIQADGSGKEIYKLT